MPTCHRLHQHLRGHSVLFFPKTPSTTNGIPLLTMGLDFRSITIIRTEKQESKHYLAWCVVQQCSVNYLGLDNAGKTTLMRILVDGTLKQYPPTLYPSK